MRLDLRPSRASALVPFQACSLQTLDSCEFANAYSAVSEDGTLTWVSKGAVLEVVSTSAGHRVASLNVEHLLRDEEATIKCVCEFRSLGRTQLLVGVNGSSEQGMVVLLDVPASVVVKAVEIPQQVTVVEKVLTYGGDNIPHWALSEQLRQFHGIVAVGTEGGYTYLVDMHLDRTSCIDSLQKVMPSPLLLLDPRERDVETMRQQAAVMGQHLAVRLGVDEQMNSNDCFHFRRPDLSVVQSLNEDEVQVSSLKYVPQSGTLAAGYSFGGFHLWKLFNPVLEYTSSVEPEDLPVAFFVYQEPENDPKNFAYIWVCRDDRVSEQKQESLCSVSLYQMSYSRKTFYASYGNFYEELNSVALRMDHNLTVDPYNSRNTTTWSSQLLSAVIISDPNYRPPSSLTVNDSFDEGCQGPDLSLCAFVWEAHDSRPGGGMEVYFSLFDMNRWYHAQMPSRIKCVNVGGQEVCPYFAVYRMSEAVQREGYGVLLNVQLRPGSLLRFLNNSPMPPEQHFYPSSLAFETVCVLDNGIVSASVLGVQRQVLDSLGSSGPACLLKPFDLYHRCIQIGLLARSTETPSPAMSSEEQQRMALLTLALEQGKIRFITACVRSWADGEFYQQGCTLQFLLSWAWARVTAIKQQIDTTCQPLFNWCGTPVDQRMLQALQNCLCCLGHLKTVLHMLLTQSTPVTDQGQVELEQRIKIVTLLHHHLKVILWFVHNGLLPEHNESGEASPSHYIYPSGELTQVFRDRRRQMSQPYSGRDTHQMILIDALVHSAGDAVSQLWKNEEGTGMYPPPSLHAALSTYLLDGVGENTKNAIILYLLFDMAGVAHGQYEQFAEKIPLFAETFDLPLGLMQQIHGFWLIDHMDFEEGLTSLLRHSSCQDVGPWQHTCILCALMHHGEVAAASRYLTMRNPPILTAEDLKMRLTILVANRLVWQAVTYVRNSCGTVDQEEMLRHIFLHCQQSKLMDHLFKLPLTDQEEKCLQNYLSESADSTSAELLVLRLLQRAQYVPAIRLNDRMKHRATMDMSAKARDRTKTRNTVVDGFRHSLPATQQYLINNPTTVPQASVTRKIDVPRPKPLSTVITQRAEQRANSKSALILAVMDKVAEAGKLLAEENRERGEEEEEKMVKSAMFVQHKDLPVSDSAILHKPGPFLCTPSTPKVHSRLSVGSQVVYPAVREMTLNFLSAAAPTSPLSSAVNTTSRRSQVFTADCMSLLQTPKIDHTPARLASPVRRTTTPHSILKVSRLPRTSPRSKGGNLSPRIQPKQLGFSSSLNLSAPPPATPTTLTPSSTPSPTEDVPPLSSKAVADVTKSNTEHSAAEVAIPKQIRFADPETREISPYVSPDELARRPLRSPSEDSEQESPSGEPMAVSDDEITFNLSRQVAEPMDTENESDSSTVPMAIPSPVFLTPPPAEHSSSSAVSNLSPPAAPPSEQEKLPIEAGFHESDGLSSAQSRQTQPCFQGQSQTLLSEEEVADAQGGRYTKISPRERSPVAVSTSKEKESKTRKERTSEISPRTRSRSSADHQEVVMQTSVFRETRQTSSVSGEHREEYKIQVVSEQIVQSVSGTTVVTGKTSPQDLSPVIECDDGSQVTPAHSVEAMETIEPTEENILLAVRQADPASKSITEEANTSDTVEVAGDDDLPDLEIKPPTPIQLTPQRETPDRTVKPAPRRTRLRKESASASVEKEDKDTQATPPKLRRISPRRTAGTVRQGEWFDEMPPLQIEVSDDENSNDNHTQRSSLPSPSRRSTWSSADHSPPVSPSRKSTRSSTDRSPPVSPSRRSTRSSTDRSPPVSPARRFVRKSVDRSPPPSPSRSSLRRSEERGVTPERTLRSSKSSSESLTIQTESSSDEMMPPPSSPARRATRQRTPERSSSTKAKTPERTTKTEDAVMESSDSGIESGKQPDSTTATDTDLPSAAVEEEVSRSPGRRTTERAETHYTTKSSHKKLESLRTSTEEEKSEETATSKSPTRRSTRRSKTPDVKSISPSRRSERHSKTPERQAGSVSSSSGVKQKKITELPPLIESEDPLPASSSTSRRAQSKEQTAVATPASPSRRSTRSGRTVSGDSVEPAPASPGLSVHSDKPVSVETVDSAESTVTQEDTISGKPVDSATLSPSRRASRSRPKTPERSPARTRLRGKGSEGDGESALEVKAIAAVTEEVRSSRRQQKEASPRAGAPVTRVTEETGDAPSFQFAPPTPLSRIQADSSLAPAGEVSAFIFSPPITRSTGSQAAPASASTSTDVASGSVQSKTMREPEKVLETVPETAQSTSEAVSETTGGKKSRRTTQSRKKTKKPSVPSASPTDSPIKFISPGEPDSSGTQPERGSRLPSQQSKSAGATRARVLRKRKAKLW